MRTPAEIDAFNQRMAAFDRSLERQRDRVLLQQQDRAQRVDKAARDLRQFLLFVALPLALVGVLALVLSVTFTLTGH